MTAYTLTAPELKLEAFETGLAKITAATKELAPAAKTALMLAGGPLIGLVFVIALPALCAALTAYYGCKLIAARWPGIWRHVKNVALFLAAPFVGLAYIVAFPFVGFGALVYYGLKATRR